MKALVSGTCAVLSESLLERRGLVLAWAEVLASLAPASRLARTVMGCDSSLASSAHCLAVITSFYESSKLTILKSPTPRWRKVLYHSLLNIKKGNVESIKRSAKSPKVWILNLKGLWYILSDAACNADSIKTNVFVYSTPVHFWQEHCDKHLEDQ